MQKHERKKLYNLARAYTRTLNHNARRLSTFQEADKHTEALLLKKTLIGMDQFHQDFLEMLKELKIPFEVLKQEFEST